MMENMLKAVDYGCTSDHSEVQLWCRIVCESVGVLVTYEHACREYMLTLQVSPPSHS